jgi:hypothetical protein
MAGAQGTTSSTAGAWLLLGLLSACGKPAPASANDAKAKDAASGEETLKEDAVAAMAKLAGHWVLQGTAESPAEKPKEWHRHAGSGTCMPKGSAGWELAKENVYGPDDESVSLFNDGLKTLVTLYTYPARQDIDAEFEAVQHDIAGTCTEGPMMTTVVNDAHFVGCVHRLESGVLLLEQAVLVQRDKWLYKTRVTFPEPALDAAYQPAMSLSGLSFKPCAGS